MNAIVNNATGLLGACLVRALRWEGHSVTAVVRSLAGSEWMSGDAGVSRVMASGGGLPELSSADVLFETTDGSVAVVSEDGFSRFSTGALLAPGAPGDSALAQWVAGYFETGRVQRCFGGSRITDARDVALAMVDAGERRMSGHFVIAGPWMEYQEILSHYESTTGVEARGGGRVQLSPGLTTFFGETYPSALRPVTETLSDVLQWHEYTARSCVQVA